MENQFKNAYAVASEVKKLINGMFAYLNKKDNYYQRL